MKCDTIPYLSGFIEVSSGIHPSCVNIESLELHGGIDLRGVTWVSDASISESDIYGNTELELTAEQARRMAQALMAAAEAAEAEYAQMRTCEECDSEYRGVASFMETLCPECAHHLHDYPNCNHEFETRSCKLCSLERTKSG